MCQSDGILFSVFLSAEFARAAAPKGIGRPTVLPDFVRVGTEMGMAHFNLFIYFLGGKQRDNVSHRIWQIVCSMRKSCGEF